MPTPPDFESSMRIEDLLRVVLEDTSDAFFLKDKNFRYLFVNQAGARLFGKARSEIIGRTGFELFSMETAKKLSKRVITKSWVAVYP